MFNENHKIVIVMSSSPANPVLELNILQACWEYLNIYISVTALGISTAYENKPRLNTLITHNFGYK